jgi:hypothetical protein
VEHINLRIVVAGQPKSGTTALYFRIKSSVPPDAWCLFEPKAYAPPARREEPPWVVAKVLIGRVYPSLNEGRADDFTVDHASFASFDRKLHIIRDPRDNLVSSFLYGVRHTSFFGDKRRLDRFLARLEEKEREPAAVSMIELLNLMAELDGGVELLPSFLARQELVVQFVGAYPDYHRVSYSDLVHGQVSDIEDYVGFPLAANARVESRRRVERTLGSGDWKNWFTDQDVAVLRPLLDRFVQFSGTDDDWEVSDAPVIPAEYGSNYVRRIVSEKREKQRRRWRRRVNALSDKWRTFGDRRSRHGT